MLLPCQVRASRETFRSFSTAANLPARIRRAATTLARNREIGARRNFIRLYRAASASRNKCSLGALEKERRHLKCAPTWHANYLKKEIEPRRAKIIDEEAIGASMKYRRAKRTNDRNAFLSVFNNCRSNFHDILARGEYSRTDSAPTIFVATTREISTIASDRERWVTFSFRARMLGPGYSQMTA